MFCDCFLERRMNLPRAKSNLNEILKYKNHENISSSISSFKKILDDCKESVNNCPVTERKYLNPKPQIVSKMEPYLMNTNEEKGQINLHSSNWLFNSNFRQRFLIASQLTALHGEFVLLEIAEFCCLSSEKALLSVYFPPTLRFCTLITKNEYNHIKRHCYGSLFGKF